MLPKRGSPPPPTKTRFVKGKSGNPGGRPKIVKHVRELARVHTDAAIETLEWLMKYSDKHSVRQASAEALLDRGWGRPSQTIGEDPENPFGGSPPQTVEEALEFVKTTSGGDTGKR